MRYLFTLLIMLVICTGSKATHLIGGEITYKHLGNNNYEVKLVVYRDCNNGVAPFDSPASIGIYDAGANLVDLLNLSPVIDTIPSTSNDTCYNNSGQFCIDRGIYTGMINLPPLTGGYTLTYQRCCRPAGVVNITAPNIAGFTISCSIPDAANANNSSPDFTNILPLYVCAGYPFNFDHSATDPDGDLLVYELCSAIDGASPTYPQPSPPSPPPYSTVTYSSAYSMMYPVASSPAFAIDPATGILSGTPTQSGSYVIAICVKEYRNNTLISTVRREVLLNVRVCQDPATSVLFDVSHNCGYSVSFTHGYAYMGSFYWDFGVSSTTTDTSTQAMPSYIYPSSGSYTVTLIVQPNTNCADTATAVLSIQPCDPSSVISVDAPQLKIYPNPSSGDIFIETSSSVTTYTLEMIDARGIVVMQRNCSNCPNNILIDAAHLPQGLYLVRMIADGRAFEQRVVVGKKD